jgi:hypothetical protein
MNISAIILNDNKITTVDKVKLSWSKTPKNALILVYTPNLSQKNDIAVKLFATINHRREDMEVAIYCASKDNTKLVFKEMTTPYIVIVKNNILQSVYSEDITPDTISRLITTIVESDMVNIETNTIKSDSVKKIEPIPSTSKDTSDNDLTNTTNDSINSIGVPKGAKRSYRSYDDAYEKAK